MIRATASRPLAVLALVLGTLFLSAGSATAAPNAPHVPGDEASVGICAVQDAMGSSGTTTTALLPVNRWQAATVDFHSNLDEGFTKDVVEKAQRDGGMTGGMQVGNAAWATLTDATEFAVSFCAVDTVGGAVDQVAGAIGKAFLAYMEIIILAFFIAIVALLWRSFRHGRASWRPMVTKLAALLLLGVTTVGASASTGGGIDGDTQAAYSPGAMSPGWIAQKTSTVIGEFTATPAGMIGYIGTEFDKRGQDEATKSPLTSCTAYNNALRDQYKWIYGGEDEKAMSSAVPMIMSGMWEDTGLATWRASQFDDRNFDESVWCHLLDWSAGTPVGGPNGTNGHHTVWSIYKKANGGTEPKPWAMGAPAVRPGDQDAVSRSIMALTACRANGATDLDKPESWTVRPEFTPDTKSGWTKSKINPEDCANWWSKDGNTQGAFKVPTDKNKIADEVNNAGLADYMNTVHGNTNKVGLITVPVYAITAIITLFVFGGMVIAVILASLALALVPIALPMVLLAIIFMPMANFSRLKKWFLSVIGLSIIISAVALILSLVTAMTSLLLLLASGILGAAGSLVSILFHTLAPIAAIWLLHLFFTKGLKAPSPFTPAGLTAWGSRVPGIGGAAMGGAAAVISRRSNQMQSMATSRARSMASATASGFGGNLTGSNINAARRGAVMDALGAGGGRGAGTGAGAVGAGAAGAAAGGILGGLAGGAGGRRGSAAAKKGASAVGAGLGAAGAGVGAGLGAAGAAAGQLGGKAGKNAGKVAGKVAATAAGDQALQAAMASSLFGAAAGSTAAAAAKELKPKSRAEQRAAFNAEAAAAREHFGVSRKSTSLGASLLRTPQNIKGSVHDTWKSFKSTPLQTTKALAAAGGTQAAVAGAGLVVGGLPALAAVGVAGGAVYAANKYRQGKVEGKAMDATLAQAYRVERQAAEAKQVQEAREAKKKAKGKPAVGAPSTSGEGTSAQDGDWQSLDPRNAPVEQNRRGSVGDSLPKNPATSEIPAVAKPTESPAGQGSEQVTGTAQPEQTAAPVEASVPQADAPVQQDQVAAQLASQVAEQVAAPVRREPVLAGVAAGVAAGAVASKFAGTQTDRVDTTTATPMSTGAPSTRAGDTRRGSVGQAAKIDQDRGTGTPPRPAHLPQSTPAAKPAVKAAPASGKIDQDRGTGTPPRPAHLPQPTPAAKPATKTAVKAAPVAGKPDQDRGTGTPPRPAHMPQPKPATKTVTGKPAGSAQSRSKGSSKAAPGARVAPTSRAAAVNTDKGGANTARRPAGRSARRNGPQA